MPLTTGTVHYIDESGNCSEKFSVDGPIKALFYHESRDIIVAITESLMLTQHRISVNGEMTELSKVYIYIYNIYILSDLLTVQSYTI